MDKYLELYERNRKLDDIFYKKYLKIEDKFYEKNCLEIIVELGELANESRCFKYWSIKKSNKDLVLEEYADCMLMCLYFFNEYSVNDIEIIDIQLHDDILVAFNDVIRMCTYLMDKDNVTERLLKEIFTYLLHIGKLLELNDNEILDACYKKIEKNEERLSSSY